MKTLILALTLFNVFTATANASECSDAINNLIEDTRVLGNTEQIIELQGRGVLNLKRDVIQPVYDSVTLMADQVRESKKNVFRICTKQPK